jgi:hypothetical protein
MISKLFMSAVSTCAWIRPGGEMRTKTAIEFCNLREVSCDFTQLRRLVVVGRFCNPESHFWIGRTLVLIEINIEF